MVRIFILESLFFITILVSTELGSGWSQLFPKIIYPDKPIISPVSFPGFWGSFFGHQRQLISFLCFTAFTAWWQDLDICLSFCFVVCKKGKIHNKFFIWELIFFYLLQTFCPHLGKFFFVVSSSLFQPNFTSGLLQVINRDLG